MLQVGYQVLAAFYSAKKPKMLRSNELICCFLQRTPLKTIWGRYGASQARELLPTWEVSGESREGEKGWEREIWELSEKLLMSFTLGLLANSFFVQMGIL